jgi:NTP pyrophosphatase (non-canonical NTP hydrolase)
MQRVEGQMIDWSLFHLHLIRFIKDHGITWDLAGRKVKLQEEVDELYEALDSGSYANIISEACDVIIICFHILLVCGVKNPLWTCFMKLEEVRARTADKKTKAKGYNL